MPCEPKRVIKSLMNFTIMKKCVHCEFINRPIVKSQVVVARSLDQGISRRAALMAPILFYSVVDEANAVGGAPDLQSSPFFQELLRKTEENKERRAQERLNDYNKRNYREYFLTQLNSRVLSEETKQKIKKWLDENED